MAPRTSSKPDDNVTALQRVALELRGTSFASDRSSPGIAFPSRLDSWNVMLPPTSVFARWSPSPSASLPRYSPAPGSVSRGSPARNSPPLYPRRELAPARHGLPRMPSVAPMPVLPRLALRARASAPQASEIQPTAKLAASPQPVYDLAVSPPRCRGLCLHPWSFHPVYKLNLAADNGQVAQLLPEVLPPFADAKRSWLARLKRDLLFSKPFMFLLGGRKLGVFKPAGDIDEADLLDILGTYNDKKDRRHNIVITSQSLLLARNAVSWSTLDWIMSKHVLVCGQAPDVRFAGELWKDKDNRVHLTANSGTYKPSADALARALRLLHRKFPHLDIVSE